jgi:tetratricopeptide (TPR) repeat protein
MKNSKSAHQSRVNPALGFAAVLVGLGFLIYSNTFHSSFHFDDQFAVVDNAAIRDLNLKTIWGTFNTRFLAGVSLAANYAWGRLEVFGYHLFNVAVHVLASFLVYLLAGFIFGTPGLKDKPIFFHRRTAAFFAAAVFLTHPLQTEAVAYIWQRCTSMVAVFYLLSLVCYVRARLRASPLFYCFSLAAALAAMFCKENAFTLPLAVGLYEGCFFGKSRESKREALIRILPFVLIAGLVPLTLLREHEITGILMRPKHFGDITSAVSGEVIARADFILTEFKVACVYIRLFFFPAGQNLDHDISIAHSFTEPAVAVSFLLMTLLLAAGVCLWRRHRVISFCIFWFFLTLSLEWVVPQEDVLFEHRLYLPMAGFALFLSYWIYSWIAPQRSRWAMGLACLVIAVYSFLTYHRNFVWKDDLSLWGDAVRKSPYKARPYWNRGVAYKQRAELGHALADFDKALEINSRLSRIYTDREAVYKEKGDPHKAAGYRKQVAQLNSQSAYVYFNRANVYQFKHDYAHALEDYTTAIALKPTGEMYNNRAVTYFFDGQYQKSREDMRKAETLGYRAHPGFLKELEKALEA